MDDQFTAIIGALPAVSRPSGEGWAPHCLQALRVPTWCSLCPGATNSPVTLQGKEQHLRRPGVAGHARTRIGCPVPQSFYAMRVPSWVWIVLMKISTSVHPPLRRADGENLARLEAPSHSTSGSLDQTSVRDERYSTRRASALATRWFYGPDNARGVSASKRAGVSNKVHGGNAAYDHVLLSPRHDAPDPQLNGRFTWSAQGKARRKVAIKPTGPICRAANPRSD